MRNSKWRRLSRNVNKKMPNKLTDTNEKMPNNSTETANNLIDQIIVAAAQDDEHLKDYWISKAQGEKAVGESFVVFHLKALKKLLNE